MEFTFKEAHIDDTSLCSRCDHGVSNQDASGNTRRWCGMTHSWMAYAVERCTDFEERHSLDLYDMKQIAWVLSVDTKDRQVGFRPPKDHGKPPRERLDDY